MKPLLAFTLLVAASSLFMPSAQAQIESKQTTYALIVCESPGNQRSFCLADTQRGVKLVREISRNRCVEGRTFGYQSDGIWISGGCAAEFEIGRGGSVPGPNYPPEAAGDQVAICESLDGRRAFCRADTRGGVTLLRQLSRNECQQNRTWGYDDRGIWVDAGCRGEFSLGGYGQGGYQPGPPIAPPSYLGTIICRSLKGRQEICPAAIGRNRVDLIRQLGKRSCVQGQSWGYDRNSIWVTNGCRGEFGVMRAPEPRLLVCESIRGQRDFCPVNTVYGVEMRRQISRNPCIEGRTWGYTRNAIWVDEGCRAEFLVQ